MAQRVALGILTICSFVALACLFIDHTLSPWLFGVSGMMFIPALIALGASRRGRLGVLTIPLLLFGLYLVFCLTAMLLLSAEAEAESMWLGLPPATWLMLAGLWLAPLPAVSLGYAWYFQQSGLGETERQADEP
jgi:hypothetical protein